MEKALEELKKEYPLICDMSFEWGWKSCEEAMKPKTCGECVAYDKDGNCKEDVRISNVQGVPSSFYCKWHAPKDIQC